MQRVVAFAYTKPPAYPPSLRFAHEKKNMSVRWCQSLSGFQTNACCAVLYCGLRRYNHRVHIQKSITPRPPFFLKRVKK